VGQFKLALNELEKAARESLASAPYKRWTQWFRLAQAYREADWDYLKSRVVALAKRMKRPLPARTLSCLDSGDQRGGIYWLARCLAAEGQLLASQYALAQLQLGPGQSPSPQQKTEWRINDWKPLDDLLGAGLIREVKQLASL